MKPLRPDSSPRSSSWPPCWRSPRRRCSCWRPPRIAAAAGAGERGLAAEAWSCGPRSAPRSPPALSSLGAGFAVAKVGTAAIGALAEKPELFGRLLIFVGLAEGIAIYGLIVSILILNRLADADVRLRLHRRRSRAPRDSGWPARGVMRPGRRRGSARRSPPRALRRRWCSSPPRSRRGSRSARWRSALAALAPLTLIVPDLAGEAPVPDSPRGCAVSSGSRPSDADDRRRARRRRCSSSSRPIARAAATRSSTRRGARRGDAGRGARRRARRMRDGIRRRARAPRRARGRRAREPADAPAACRAAAGGGAPRRAAGSVAATSCCAAGASPRRAARGSRASIAECARRPAARRVADHARAGLAGRRARRPRARARPRARRRRREFVADAGAPRRAEDRRAAATSSTARSHGLLADRAEIGAQLLHSSTHRRTTPMSRATIRWISGPVLRAVADGPVRAARGGARRPARAAGRGRAPRRRRDRRRRSTRTRPACGPGIDVDGTGLPLAIPLGPGLARPHLRRPAATAVRHRLARSCSPGMRRAGAAHRSRSRRA